MPEFKGFLPVAAADVDHDANYHKTMKTVLVTGASGYIGKHITLRLLNDGYLVRASVRNTAKAEEIRRAVRPFLHDGIDLDERLRFVELDLERDAGWAAALEGVDVLMHTASPFPIASPKDENDLIRPAVEGTLRALRAAKGAGVKRVILTSSTAAIYGCTLPAGKTSYDETNWTDVNHPVGSSAYTKSKTLAEQAAWDFVANEAPDISLTTINPVLVLGAPLDTNVGSSVSIVERILNAKDPMLPDIHLSVVDVKDVAQMHVKCIEIEASKNGRFIANDKSLSFVAMATTLKAAFPGRKIVTRQAPNFIVKILALFDKEIKVIVPQLGDATPVSNERARTILGMHFIPAEQSVIDTAEFLLSNGLVRA